MDIVIALDTYDDLFSDFDIRGYGERALSKDFLDELHVRLKKHGEAAREFRLVLLVPAGCRSPREETLIRERLGDFFIERREHYLRENRNAKLKALLFVAAGLVLSIAANLVVGTFAFLPLFKDFLLVPSWFFVWSGFDLLVKRDEIGWKTKYYKTLSSSTVSFRNLEG
jgi:hypothetical protein